jgi:transitional endoplasmic reticulum ATPase
MNYSPFADILFLVFLSPGKQGLVFPEIFARLDIEAPKRILLHGPPGSGKTLIARAVAQETEAEFFHINGPEIMQRHYGESEEKLRSIVGKAQKNAPAIIFLDEIDSFAAHRGMDWGASRVTGRMVSQLLTEMDGIEKLKGVFIIGATSQPQLLDPSLLRPGRFELRIDLSLPTRDERLEIFKIHLQGKSLAPEITWDWLADKTRDWSGAQIESLYRQAAPAWLRRGMEEGWPEEKSLLLEKNPFRKGLGEKINQSLIRDRAGLLLPAPFRGRTSFL